ncbi:DUF4303 domain-containing protein [Pectobacterium brasiliense]|uniref:DUF4303 domain-containing protein n=1 Tax=Pectobacterium brasiliense TaxID=180957 RepID=UPI0038730F79
MDWNKFEENCFKLTIKLIKKILSEKPNENFYAFSLYTDSQCYDCVFKCKLEEKLKTILDADSDKSEENQTYYRWAISEWAYEGYESDFISEISKELRLSSERESFSDFKNNLINSLTNALRRTNEEILKDGGEGVIYVCIYY